MINRSVFWLLLFASCASPGWTESEPYEKSYSEKLLQSSDLNEEDLLIFKNFIPLKFRELIDHSINASNEEYGESFRNHSRNMVRSMVDVVSDPDEKEAIDRLIKTLASSSTEELEIDSLVIVRKDLYATSVSLGGTLLMNAVIQKTPKLFGKDTMRVWDIRFETLVRGRVIPNTMIK